MLNSKDINQNVNEKVSIGRRLSFLNNQITYLVLVIIIVGAFFGVLLLGILYNAMNIIGVSSYIQTIVLGAIIVIATVISNIGKMRR